MKMTTLIRLEEMTIGFTTIINGIVVTRWSETLWEAGTFNREWLSIQETVDKIKEQE